VRDAGDVHVDPLAPEGNALGQEVFALPLPHREAAIGADDAPPGGVVGDPLGREKPSAETRRARRDVAVGPHEPLRDLPDRRDDLRVALVVDAEVLATRRARDQMIDSTGRSSVRGASREERHRSTSGGITTDELSPL
jgi:hypothetical protein